MTTVPGPDGHADPLLMNRLLGLVDPIGGSDWWKPGADAACTCRTLNGSDLFPRFDDRFDDHFAE